MSFAYSQKKLTQLTSDGQGLRILVAPLDWGLGHTTRCIPLIQQLINNGVEVLLAGEEKISALLSEAFPRLPILPLKGYRVHYRGESMVLNIACQVPKILSAIRAEHHWLQQAVQQYHINAVVSDNRYGLYHSHIPSVIITHQLRIHTGFGPGPDALLQQIHYRYLNKFSFCWVPDEANPPGLAGPLSHPHRLPRAETYFIGPLSRLFPQTSASKTSDLLFLLSGPEPQRTEFEKQILGELENFSGNAVLVRGLPGSSGSWDPHVKGLTTYNHLPATALAQAIAAAKTVVCRSGYSTIMDLAALGAPAVLVPTPGQTEQELLARYAHRSGWAALIPQKHFSLSAVTASAAQVHRFPQLSPTTAALQPALDALFRVCSR